MPTGTLTIKYSEDVEDVFGKERTYEIELDTDEVERLRATFNELVKEYSKPEMPFYAYTEDGGIRRVTDPAEQKAFAEAAARKTIQQMALHGNDGVFAILPLPEEVMQKIRKAAGEE